MTASDSSSHDSTRRQRDTDTTALLRRADVCLTNEPRVGEWRWLARAPGRLDVMGGIAEYTGAVVLATPLAEGVIVTVQLRDDDKITIYGRGPFAVPDRQSITLDLAVLDADGVPVADENLAERLGSADAPWLRPVAGVLHAMGSTGKLDGTQSGVTIVVDGELPPLIDVAYSAAVGVALLMAVSEAWGLRLDPFECAQLAMSAENDVAGNPCGASAALCALHGEPGSIVQINCQDNSVLAPLDLPENVILVGIDCGAKRADAHEKYVCARTAAFMGGKIIERILAAQNGRPVQWTGWLAKLTVDDYVRHFRARIPTKIRGADFLERFGETADPLTQVEPKTIYKIRSRTEHHIYEAARTRRFVERLAYAARTRDRTALKEAGDLMYASHWSYGQRCGLGSIETDALVNNLRDHDRRSAGIHGAKISGQGAGGVVVVLMEETQRARAALRDAVDEYQRATSLTARVFEGSSLGAVHYKVHHV